MSTTIDNGSCEYPKKRSFESWLGCKALGVIAAVLVLVGLGMLGAVLIPQLNDTLKASLVFAFAASLMSAGTILAYRKLNAFTTALLVCGAGALVIAVLLAHYHFAVIGNTLAFAMLAAWVCLCFGMACVTRSVALPIATMAFMAVRGFEELDTLAPYPAVALAFGTLALVQFAVTVIVVVDERAKAGTLRVDMRNAHVTLLVACEVIVIILVDASSFAYNDEVAHIAFIAILLLMALLPRARRDARYYLPLRVNEIVVLFFVALCWWFGNRELVASIVVGVALVGAAAILSIRVGELPKAAPGSLVRKAGLVVMCSIAFTCCLMGYLHGHTTLVMEPYAYSAVLMACALALIVVGFRYQASPLRLYGLIVALFSTVKMVTVDAYGLDTLTRVIAFVVSGLMCFAASALYNYAGKHLQS